MMMMRAVELLDWRVGRVSVSPAWVSRWPPRTWVVVEAGSDDVGHWSVKAGRTRWQWGVDVERSACTDDAASQLPCECQPTLSHVHVSSHRPTSQSISAEAAVTTTTQSHVHVSSHRPTSQSISAEAAVTTTTQSHVHVSSHRPTSQSISAEAAVTTTLHYTAPILHIFAFCSKLALHTWSWCTLYQHQSLRFVKPKIKVVGAEFERVIHAAPRSAPAIFDPLRSRSAHMLWSVMNLS